jgi:hypothetical protein
VGDTLRRGSSGGTVRMERMSVHAASTAAGGTVQDTGTVVVHGDVSERMSNGDSDGGGAIGVGRTAARWASQASPTLARLLVPALQELAAQRPESTACVHRPPTLNARRTARRAQPERWSTKVDGRGARRVVFICVCVCSACEGVQCALGELEAAAPGACEMLWALAAGRLQQSAHPSLQVRTRSGLSVGHICTVLTGFVSTVVKSPDGPWKGTTGPTSGHGAAVSRLRTTRARARLVRGYGSDGGGGHGGGHAACPHLAYRGAGGIGPRG